MAENINKQAATQLGYLNATLEAYRAGKPVLDNWSIEGVEALLTYLAQFDAGMQHGDRETNKAIEAGSVKLTNDFLTLLKLVYLKLLREDFTSIRMEQLECELLLGVRVNSMEQLMFDSTRSDAVNNRMLFYRAMHHYLELLRDYFDNDIDHEFANQSKELCAKIPDDIMESLGLGNSEELKLIVATCLLDCHYRAQFDEATALNTLAVQIAQLTGHETATDELKNKVVEARDKLGTEIETCAKVVEGLQAKAISAINDRIKQFDDLLEVRGMQPISTVQAESERYMLSSISGFKYEHNPDKVLRGVR